MSCESALPSWCRAAGLPQSCFVAECSVVDPKSREMLVKSSNLSGASLMVIEETCRYSASPAAPAAATLYKQEAKITAFLPFLAGKVRWANHSIARRGGDEWGIAAAHWGMTFDSNVVEMAVVD